MKHSFVRTGEHRLIRYYVGPAGSPAEMGLGNRFENGRWQPRTPNAPAAARIGQFNGAQTLQLGLLNGARPAGFSTTPAFRNYQPYRPIAAPTYSSYAPYTPSYSPRYGNTPTYALNHDVRPGGFGQPHGIDQHLQDFPRSYAPYPNRPGNYLPEHDRPMIDYTNVSAYSYTDPLNGSTIFLSRNNAERDLARYYAPPVVTVAPVSLVGTRPPSSPYRLPSTFPSTFPSSTPASTSSVSSAPRSTPTGGSDVLSGINRTFAAREADLRKRSDALDRSEAEFQKQEAALLKTEQELQAARKRGEEALDKEIARLQTEMKQGIAKAREATDKRIAEVDPTLPNAVALITAIGEEFTKTEALIRTQQEQALKKINEQNTKNVAALTARLETARKQVDQLRANRANLRAQREDLAKLRRDLERERTEARNKLNTLRANN